MLRGLYTGASGMIAQMHRMDALANNLANVDVAGYKRDISVQKAFPELLLRRLADDGVYAFPFGSAETGPLVGKLGTGVEFNELFTVFEQGSLKETDNVFDLALDGEGFFTIDTPEGERYTRNGSFVLGAEGLLTTKAGNPVVGQNGYISLKENNFVIDARGGIWQNAALAADPDRLISIEENEWESLELVDTLSMVDFRRTRYLQKQGNSMWQSTFESGQAEEIVDSTRPKLYQGFLESSNVNSVLEMVNMIEVNRSYEANQKVIQTQDSLAGRLVNDAIRV